MAIKKLSVPYCIRQHPMDESKYGFKTYRKIPLIKDLKTAKCLVTYCSSIATESVINGVPIVLYGKQLAKHVASSDVDNLIYPDRQPWLNWMAYQHWSINDLKSDKWIRYYKDVGQII